MKDGDKYYCGPDTLPQWLKKPASKYFNEACKQHDIDYANGSDRLLADKMFYMSMKKIANEQPTLAKRNGAKFQAWLYYKAVRWFGAKHWGKNET